MAEDRKIGKRSAMNQSLAPAEQAIKMALTERRSYRRRMPSSLPKAMPRLKFFFRCRLSRAARSGASVRLLPIQIADNLESCKLLFRTATIGLISNGASSRQTGSGAIVYRI